MTQILLALVDRHKRETGARRRIAYDTAAMTVDGIGGLFARRPRRMRKFEEYYREAHRDSQALKAQFIAWGRRMQAATGK